MYDTLVDVEMRRLELVVGGVEMVSAMGGR